jgi:carotenoid 1,2-hydratase
MTERGRARVSREARDFVIGPSRMRWDGAALVIDIDEIGVPLPRRVRGRIRVHPQGLSPFVAALDDGARHRWGPIAACARIEVDLERPAARWSGEAYVDANEGDEPIDRPFRDWDWSRSAMRDGSTAVIYDVRQKRGDDRVIARLFRPDGGSQPFEAPARQRLPRTGWRIERSMRNEGGDAARVTQTLEDTPFYARSLLESTLLGERVRSIHESLSLPRVVSRSVRLMLPWRMPRIT